MRTECISHRVEHYREALIDLSLKIWSEPEGPYQEYKAAEWCAEMLEKHGFTVVRHAGNIATALEARFGSGHPIIGFLGEYDALPGLSNAACGEKAPLPEQKYGHGCGHNLIAAACVGAALALKDEIAAEHLAGTVVFYGCPAEELLTGKPLMARAGLFDSLDAAFAFHPMEANMTTYGNMTAVNIAKFHYRGQTAHAASNPYDGRSALDAVQLMNIGCEFLREHIPTDAKIHYMITECGEVPNIIPDKASVVYYVRAPEREDVEAVYERLVQLAQGAALMTGTEVSIEFQGGCYGGLNNHVLEDVVRQAMLDISQEPWTENEIQLAKELNNEFSHRKTALCRAYGLPEEAELFRGVLPTLSGSDGSSSDIGDVAHIVPTAFFTTACQNLAAPGHHWQITACSGHSIGQKGMLYGAKILAKAGLDILTDPTILKRANDEFQQATRGKHYKCPIPESTCKALFDAHRPRSG